MLATLGKWPTFRGKEIGHYRQSLFLFFRCILYLTCLSEIQRCDGNSTMPFPITKANLLQINVQNKLQWQTYLDGPKNADKIRGKNSQDVTETQMEVESPTAMDQ